jgi:hypothetical protein
MWQAYFVAYRVNYVQAITSQERQGAGFTLWLPTRAPRESVAGVAAVHHRGDPLFSPSIHIAVGVSHTCTTNAPGQFRVVVAYLAERFCHG